jgi:hypothetical protein
MANINDGLLWFEAPQGTEAQLRTGLAAAHGVLIDAGAEIEDAYRASWQPEALQGTGRRMSQNDKRLHDTWWAATAATIQASGAIDGSLFPAELGKERNRKALADLASGRVLEVIPAPDRGPYFAAEPPSR